MPNPTPEQAALINRMLVEVLSAFESIVPDLRAAYLDPANDRAALERITEERTARVTLQVEGIVGGQLGIAAILMIVWLARRRKKRGRS